MNWIDQKIAEHDAQVYGGEMPARNKALLRKELEKDERIWEKQNADYSPADAGEPPKGAEW